VGRTGRGVPYLLLKADASQIPLANNSVSLVIATPPDLGVKHRPKGDYCTSDPTEYRLLIGKFLKEATRIVTPGRKVLLISDRSRIGKSKGARRVVVSVLQKRVSGGHWTLEQLKSVTFLTHYIDIGSFPWWALATRLYRNLIRRYSEVGEIIAHVFSGSGNGGIAALELARKPVLIDLHYHRQIKERLRKKVQSTRARIVPPGSALDKISIPAYTAPRDQ
jgi:DNA modification methylase